MKSKQLFALQFLKKLFNQKYFKVFANHNYTLLRTENSKSSFNICIQKNNNKVYFKGVGTVFNDGDFLYLNNKNKIICDNYLYFSIQNEMYYDHHDLTTSLIICKYNTLENKLYYSNSIKNFYNGFKIFRYKNHIVFEFITEEHYMPGSRVMLDVPKIHYTRMNVDKLACHEYLINEDNTFTHDKLISLGAKDIKLNDAQELASIPNKFFE